MIRRRQGASRGRIEDWREDLLAQVAVGWVFSSLFVRWWHTRFLGAVGPAVLAPKRRLLVDLAR